MRTRSYSLHVVTKPATKGRGFRCLGMALILAAGLFAGQNAAFAGPWTFGVMSDTVDVEF
jgi:hypothetical protein